MLVQGPLLITAIGAVAVIMLWISAVGELPSQVASGAGGARWAGHPLGTIMGQIEHSACESYRTCCRDPNLAPVGINKGQQTTRSDTCSSAPQAINTTVRFDQGDLVLSDASQPAFCDAISGSTKHTGGGISFDACEALDAELNFDIPLCQKEFCYEAIPAYHAFLTRVVDGVRGSYLVPALILLSLLIGGQVARMFVFRELIQNAPHRRAAIDLADAKALAHEIEHDVAVVARESVRIVRNAEHEAIHDAAIALDKLEDALHIRHTKHANLHPRNHHNK